MLDTSSCVQHEPVARAPIEWVKTLAKYREPNMWRSLFELAVTAGPFVLLWGLAWWSLSYSYWLALGIAVLNGGFLLRLFVIQHDCGHGSFFRSRRANDWVGRVIGVLTLTPYDFWRYSHGVHHATSGNLDHRGIGDVDTLTVRALDAIGSDAVSEHGRVTLRDLAEAATRRRA